MNKLETEINAITTTMSILRKNRDDAMEQGDKYRVEELTNVLDEYQVELDKRLNEAGN